MVQSDSKNLLINCFLLSISTKYGVQNGKIQWSVTIDVMCAAALLDVGMPLVNFENQSIITNTNWSPFDVSDSGPRMSIKRNSSEQLVGNSCNGRLCFSYGLFRTHSRQAFTVVYN